MSELFIPKIKWEKWVDPFGDNSIENKWNKYDDEADEVSSMFEEHIENKIPKQVRVISTPMGLIPYNEYTASSKIFNFWVGHANFNLSEEVFEIIDECEGVEILDPFTRYRFRIGVGKCFQDKEVMSGVNTAVYNYINSIEEEQET